MKNKRLSVTICACLLLVACGRAEQTAPAAVDAYDYLIKVTYNELACWKQNAGSIRYDNDYLYFNYDHYGYQEPTGELQVWIRGANTFIDIAVVAKGVLDTGIGSGLPSPEDMQLHPIEERKMIVVK